MHFNCVICSDLFTPSSDIYTTPCGHIFHHTCLMQWLKNSKTCPQCRTKISSSSLLRLYLNTATSRSSDVDVTVLQHKLDGTEYAMRLKDKEIRNATSKNEEMRVQNQSLRAQIVELEATGKRYESVLAAHKEQLKFFKKQAKDCDKLQNEVAKLKVEMKNLENVQIAINGTREAMSEIIRNENSVESIGLLAATLKKSLIDADRTKKELQHELKKSRNKLSQYKREMAEKKNGCDDLTKQLELLKSNHEKEVTYLKNKFSQLQAKVTKGVGDETFNNSIMRIISESPVNYSRTPVLSGHREEFIDLSEIPDTPPSSARSQFKPMEELKIDDDSPLPASSMGLYGLQKKKVLGSNAAKTSIFKGTELNCLASSQAIRNKASDVMYNGLGGSSKEDVYPTAGKRPKFTLTSSKFRKLSAEAGKSKKVPEFFNVPQ